MRVTSRLVVARQRPKRCVAPLTRQALGAHCSRRTSAYPGGIDVSAATARWAADEQNRPAPGAVVPGVLLLRPLPTHRFPRRQAARRTNILLRGCDMRSIKPPRPRAPDDGHLALPTQLRTQQVGSQPPAQAVV